MAEIVTIENTARSKKVRRMFGIDLDSWNLIMIWSLGIGAVAALAVVVSQAAVIKLQKLVEVETIQAFERYKVEAAEKIAAANAVAESAKADVAKADESIEIQRREIAEANTRTKEAELALQKFRADRYPTESELLSLTEKIKPFTGVEFDAGMNLDREVQNFLWRLEPALWAAGWKQVDWIGPPEYTYPAVPQRPLRGRAAVINVSIEMHPQSRERFTSAADALVSALKDIGIDARDDDFNVHNDNPNAIHVLIGTKR